MAIAALAYIGKQPGLLRGPVRRAWWLSALVVIFAGGVLLVLLTGRWEWIGARERRRTASADAAGGCDDDDGGELVGGGGGQRLGGRDRPNQWHDARGERRILGLCL